MQARACAKERIQCGHCRAGGGMHWGCKEEGYRGRGLAGSTREGGEKGAAEMKGVGGKEREGAGVQVGWSGRK